MPSPFLTLNERVRLTCFPDAIPQWDLITYFTLTEHDGSLIDTYQGDTNRLGVALQLCAVRYLGFCPADLHTASSDVTTFLARQLQVDPSALHDYGKRRMTRSTHFNAVLHHLGFRRIQPDDHEPIVAWLPATRALKTSPIPRSMIVSAGARESIQLRITAAGYCPVALAFCWAR
jgi:hypothetical protein